MTPAQLTQRRLNAWRSAAHSAARIVPTHEGAFAGLSASPLLAQSRPPRFAPPSTSADGGEGRASRSPRTRRPRPFSSRASFLALADRAARVGRHLVGVRNDVGGRGPSIALYRSGSIIDNNSSTRL